MPLTKVSVQVADIATQAQAEGGTETTSLMTPLRTQQAITNATTDAVFQGSTNDGSTDALQLLDSGGTEVCAINTNGLAEFGSYVRTNTAIYSRYYHIPLSSANPGASGATWVPPDANTPGGWQLNAVGELLYADADVHADWDGASDLTLELKFAVNVDNSGGTSTDTVDVRAQCFYAGNGDTSTKTQTVEIATVVGACAQYTIFTAELPIDYDAVDNVVEVGDVIGFIINLETDTSEVDDIVLISASFHYHTTHVGIESADT